MSEPQQNEEPQSAPETVDESLQLWIQELAHHLEIEDISIDAAAVTTLAEQARDAVNGDAGAVTTFLVGYVSGLAEASGQADFETASRAATRVAERLLQRRSNAVG
ncbi:DUF6457 domain-containing protein [Nesterenkonia massiliensis]|uniref:DUF6457 domain-containing protein n=2 Tax=Nesterenkonia TaxID=57494 RepID=A0ABP9FV45_9MICC|nr:DUF6457 domain-containing protein [Nesterenkonia massiliensis]MCT1607638.1 DUF6457 domain-containing protein [Nesterenkonia massiliensis]